MHAAYRRIFRLGGRPSGEVGTAILLQPEHVFFTCFACGKTSGRYHPALKVGDGYTSVKIYAQDSMLEVFERGILYPAYIELLIQDVYAERMDKVEQVILTEGSKVVAVGMFTKRL